MQTILLCLAQYAIILLVIAALAGLGIFIGISLRKKKNAKDALAEANDALEE